MTAAHDQQASKLKAAADAQSKAGNYHEAASLYSQALQQASGDMHLQSTLLANRSLALMKTQQPQAALVDATKALQLRPRWHKAHLRLAQSAEGLGDRSAAIAAYRRALDLEPFLGEAVTKALAALELRQSREQCRLALKKHPGAVVNIGALRTRLAATACADGIVRVWCATTGTLLQALPGHTDMATCIEWSPCGRFLASGSLDSTARLWELKLCSELLMNKGQAGLAGLPLPESSAAELVQLKAVLKGHTGRISSLAFSPAEAVTIAPGAAEQDSPAGARNGTLLLATGSVDCTARVWDAATGECMQVLTGHSGLITSVSISPGGQLLATASGDTRCKVWSTASGACIHDIAWDSGGVNLCGFLPQLPQPPLSAPTTVAAAAAAAAGPSSGGPAATSPASLQSSQLSKAGGLTAGEAAVVEEVVNVASPPAQPLVLLTAHIEPRRREGRILLWDLGTGEVPASQASKQNKRAQGSAAGNQQTDPQQQQPPSTAQQQEQEQGKEKDQQQQGQHGPAAAPSNCEARPACAALPTGGGSSTSGSSMAASRVPAAAPPPAQALGRKAAGWVDGKLHAPALTIDGFRGKVTSWDACAAQGGTVLLATACSDGLARVYDISLASISDGSSSSSSSSSGGSSKGGSKGALLLFELDMEHSVAGSLSTAQHDMPAWSRASQQNAAHSRNLVRFAPGGHLLAISGSDCRVSVYGLESSDQVASFLGHTASVRALAWAGAGEVVSAGEDGAVKFWRVGNRGAGGGRE
ncbi:hypothetical protein N2152v2_010480 [Parachlorella kessleri]